MSAMKTATFEFDSNANCVKINGVANPSGDTRVGKMTTMPADPQYQQFADPLRVTVHSLTVQGAASSTWAEVGDADGNAFPVRQTGNGTNSTPTVVASSDNGEIMVGANGACLVVIAYTVERF